MFEGSITALVTPFKNQELDETAFRRLIHFQMNNCTDGIVIAGSTGESATLTLHEITSLIQWAKEEMSKYERKVVLIAGTGTNSTNGTLERTRAMEELGVDGVLIVTPYYNKPTSAGLIAHFSKIAESTNLPIILYNVPGRTGVNLLPETVKELTQFKNISAIKEASGDLDQVSRLSLLCPITILSGDDTLTLPMLSLGAKGVISVTANINPALVSAMCAFWKSENFAEALRIHKELFPLSKALFIETNPIPVKAALSMMGFIQNELRLPMTPVKTESQIKIRSALESAGLLEIAS